MLFLHGKSRAQPSLHIPRAVLVIVSEKESASHSLNIEQQGWLGVRNSLCVMKCRFLCSDKSHLDKDVMKFSKTIRGMEKSSRNLPILIM